MQAAPPVRMGLAPDRVWQGAVAVCAAVAGANLAAWLSLQAQCPPAMVLAAALLTAGASSWLALWYERRRAAVGVLDWDGGQWQWAAFGGAPVAGQVRVMIDLGPWVLLRLAPTQEAQPAIWSAVSRRAAGASWPQWRAALYARAPGAGPSAEPDPK